MSNNHISNEVAADLYSALMSHYIHLDQLMWSRGQFLIALEVTALASAWVIREGLAVSVLAFVSILIVAVWIVIKRDQSNRDVNLDFIDALRDQLVTDEFKKQKLPRLRAEPRYWFARGRVIIDLIVVALLVVNVVLAILYYFKMSPFGLKSLGCGG